MSLPLDYSGQVKLRALSGASIRLVQHFRAGGPTPLFPWYRTMAPETIVPFELTLASVLRESSKSIAWLLLVKRHILYRIDLRGGRGSSHQNFLLHRALLVRAR